MDIKFERSSVGIHLVADAADHVWEVSRPNIEHTREELDRIRKEDLPIGDFVWIVFDITSSIAFRDLLFSLRKPYAAEWARSNRVDNTGIVFADEYRGMLTTPNFLENYKIVTDFSINLDTRKDHFPYAVSTTYCWATNSRQLASLLVSLKKSIPYLYEIYGKMFEEALVSSNIKLPTAKSDTLISDLCCHNVNGNVGINFDEDSGVVTGRFIKTGVFLSQFIRNHAAVIKSNFVDELMMNSLQDTVDMNQSQLFTMEIICPDKATFINMIRTRSCWFSKHDLEDDSSWSSLVVEYIKGLGLSLADTLPCNGNPDLCKYRTELESRIKAGKNRDNSLKDKGAALQPCVLITGIKEEIDKRRIKFSKDGLLSELSYLWYDFIHNDKKDMNITADGIEYLGNIKKYGYLEDSDNDGAVMNLTKELFNKYNIE